MTATVLFVHSSGPQGPGEGSEPFASRLRDELGSDYEVVFPVMPATESDPHYEPWRDRLGSELEVLKGKTILFGHSVGGSVALKYCAERGFDDRVAGLVSAATPLWGTEQEWEREWALPEGWPKRGPSLPSTFLFHSRDDEEIPFDHLDRYAKRLPAARTQALDGCGHLYDRGDISPILDAVRSL
jgi:predicted alpha/beta hydrolase family esterase